MVMSKKEMAASTRQAEALRSRTETLLSEIQNHADRWAGDLTKPEHWNQDSVLQGLLPGGQMDLAVVNLRAMGLAGDAVSLERSL